MIFKWFGGDFKKGHVNTESFNDRTEKEKAVLNFVLKYTSSEDKKIFLKKNRFKVTYINYHWNLNELTGHVP